MSMPFPHGKRAVHGVRGYYRDRMYRSDGLSVDSGWKPNLVVEQCRILLAARIKGDAGAGIQEIRIGRGDPAWDDAGPPPAPVNTESLFDSAPVVLPVASAAITYVDAGGSASATPTPRLEITVDMEPGTPAPDSEGTFPLREFGLFGEIDGSPAMIDYVRHPVIHKDATDTLVRTIRLEF